MWNFLILQLNIFMPLSSTDTKILICLLNRKINALFNKEDMKNRTHP